MWLTQIKTAISALPTHGKVQGGIGDLKVNFTGIWLLRALGIGDGNYFVIGLGPVEDRQYQWALVGEPSRKYGWILARKKLPSQTLDEIFRIAEDAGYSREQFQAFRRD